MSCQICTEKFTKKSKTEIECKYCGESCCSSCIRYYLLHKNEDAHCMVCKKVWDINFLGLVLPKSFINNDYKKHREEVLFEKEKSLLITSQPDAERQRKIDNLEKELFELRNQKSKSVIKKFIQPCPNENCKGLLSQNWKCGLCESVVCKDCQCIKKLDSNNISEHTCDPAILENVESIKKDTKKCPCCGIPTFKIIGCDQIFCVESKKAWSWKTGQLQLNVVIHNPHYFEWIQQTNGTIPRAIGDQICGGIPDFLLFKSKIVSFLMKKFKTRHTDSNFSSFEKFITVNFIDKNILDSTLSKLVKKYPDYLFEKECNILLDVYKQFLSFYQNLSHIQNWDLRDCQRKVLQDDNSQLRVNFLLDKITEKLFKKTIQKREKSRLKNIEFVQVFEMYVNTCTEYLRGFLSDEIDFETCWKSCFDLGKFANGSLDKISKVYNTTNPYFIRIRDYSSLHIDTEIQNIIK